MVAEHSRWRRRILWHGPFERCAWVSAGAAPSKKLRPSSYKIVSANFALTEFSEIRRLENVLQGQERDQHSEHAADQPLGHVPLQPRPRVGAGQPADAQGETKQPVRCYGHPLTEARCGQQLVEGHSRHRSDERPDQRRPRHRVDWQTEDGDEEGGDDRAPADTVDATYHADAEREREDRQGAEGVGLATVLVLDPQGRRPDDPHRRASGQRGYTFPSRATPK